MLNRTFNTPTLILEIECQNNFTLNILQENSYVQFIHAYHIQISRYEYIYTVK